uniref:Ig-like domain-containing protein n=1 Tax=Malurus cyaneus samueli TaxID=2593467 RepID=A0A8C5X5E9_9PASS
MSHLTQTTSTHLPPLWKSLKLLHQHPTTPRSAHPTGNEDVKIDFQVTEMPPRFAVPITDIKVTEGLDAVFECVVTGTPVPVVQWFRGDTCVTPGTGKYVVSEKEGLHSLKVQTVGPSDGGWYRCQATNKLGEAMCKGSLVVTAQQETNGKGEREHNSEKSMMLL